MTQSKLNIEKRPIYITVELKDKNNETVMENGVPVEVQKLVATAHVVKTSWGAEVILFEMASDLTPEDVATLQAMYSRSNIPIVQKLIGLIDEAKLQKVRSTVVGLSYSGYGHKSIGDLGNILLCYEGVSMLAAKAIQDSQLYAGQEASTRYITFEKQPFLFHADNTDVLHATSGYTAKDMNADHSTAAGKAREITEKYREAYMNWLPKVVEYLKAQYPWDEQEPPKDKATGEPYAVSSPEYKKAFGNYERAINARAFDIIRGFLPVGCSTNLAWWTSLSHCAEHLSWLRCHVLPELRELADCTQLLVETVYPLSFGGRTLYEEREQYKTDFYNEQYYLEELSLSADEKSGTLFLMNTDGTRRIYHDWYKPILNRPKGQDLHYTVGECYNVFYENYLDFASFRDQQRHRAVVQRHGLVTENFGFHEWYLNNLPEDLRPMAEEFLTEQLSKINELGVDKFRKQYLLPMGYKIPTRINGPLGKFLYMVELRAQTTVHPTMHQNAYDMAVHLKKALASEFGCFEDQIPMYVNGNIGEFSLKRGSQTFFVAGKEIQ